MSLPSNSDFAAEVRTDRLATLWRFTLVSSFLALWILISLALIRNVDVSNWIVSAVALMIGSVLARFLLQRDQFTPAVWAYALGAVAAIGVLLASPSIIVVHISPFLFPIIIFVVGLLLSVRSTFTLSVISSLVTLAVPVITQSEPDGVGLFQVAGVGLTFLSALLAAQVTGELYKITQWALENYQRERKTSSELYESRQEVERAFKRSEALSEKLQDTNIELERAKHFRGQFLANMSHELRTPLNAILGFSETMLKFPMMYENVELPDAYRSDLEQIDRSGRQLLSLINDILDLSKVDAGKLDIRIQPVDVDPVINDAVSTAYGLIAGKPVRLNVNMPDELPKASADPSRLRQILLNLYSNASKYTDHGSVTLSVREQDNHLLFTIADTGAGIPKDNLESIFEEFKQADTEGRDPRAGAGLGLAISRQLLTLMGGRIWAESEVGKGSTFYFTIPLYQTTEPDTTPVNSSNPVAPPMTKPEVK